MTQLFKTLNSRTISPYFTCYFNNIIIVKVVTIEVSSNANTLSPIFYCISEGTANTFEKSISRGIANTFFAKKILFY